MIKKAAIVLALVSMLCIFTCACTGKQSTTEQKTELSWSGSALSITLEENPTTGYTWAYTISDENVLSPKSDTYTQAESEEGKTGVGGTHEYVFEAKSQGKATITFELGQQWDGGEKSDQSKTYTVEVGADNQIKSVK